MFAILIALLAPSSAVAGPPGTNIMSAKVNVKKDTIYADKAAVGGFRDDAARRGSFYMTLPDGTDALYFRWVFEGDNNYMEVYRSSDLDTLLYDEGGVVGYKKWIAKRFVNAGVLTSTGLDEKALADFAKKTGTEMTKDRQRRERIY